MISPNNFKFRQVESLAHAPTRNQAPIRSRQHIVIKTAWTMPSTLADGTSARPTDDLELRRILIFSQISDSQMDLDDDVNMSELVELGKAFAPLTLPTSRDVERLARSPAMATMLPSTPPPCICRSLRSPPRAPRRSREHAKRRGD